MEKLLNLTIIKSIADWNLYDDLVWRDLKGTKRVHFFRHDLNPNKYMVVIEWSELNGEFHTIVEFYCEPTDDAAKLKFVEEYLLNLEKELTPYNDNIKEINSTEV